MKFYLNTSNLTIFQPIFTIVTIFLQLKKWFDFYLSGKTQCFCLMNFLSVKSNIFLACTDQGLEKLDSSETLENCTIEINSGRWAPKLTSKFYNVTIKCFAQHERNNACLVFNYTHDRTPRDIVFQDSTFIGNKQDGCFQSLNASSITMKSTKFKNCGVISSLEKVGKIT